MTDLSSVEGADLLQLVNDLRDPIKCNAAAADLFSQLHEFLVRRLEERIGIELQGKLSAESAVQDMWASFFRRRDAGQYRFENCERVRGLLYTIARNKLVDHIRRLNNHKCNPNSRMSCDPTNDDSSLGSDLRLHNARPTEQNNLEGEIIAAGKLIAPPERLKRSYAKQHSGPEPSASCLESAPHLTSLAQAAGTEWLTELLAGADVIAAEVFKDKVSQLDIDLKEVLRLKLQGSTVEQIASETDRSEKQIRLKLLAIEEAFEDIYNDSEFGVDARKDRPRASP